jgi:hypothetical protein
MALYQLTGSSLLTGILPTLPVEPLFAGNYLPSGHPFKGGPATLFFDPLNHP